VPSFYRIKTVVMENGERLPMLLDGTTGLPVFEPMAYILSEARARGLAANTITAQLAAIEFLLIYAQTCAIDLSERMTSGALLNLYEIDALAAAVQLTMAKLVERLETTAPPRPQAQRLSPTSLEVIRKRLPSPGPASRFVDRDTSANRMRIIRDYLAWLINQRLGRLAPDSTHFSALMAKRDLLLKAITARLPPGRGSPSKREGLDPEERCALLRVVDPSAPSNPWKDPRVRNRNHLIVQILYHLGLRGGELLALRLQDLNFRANTITIARRPDDPADPRRIQPTAKTLGRVIPMNQGLADLAFAYLAGRREIRGADQHPFLFVETDRGRPLSARALANIFQDLRLADERLFRGLSAHVLRHDWNDRFSETMDRYGTAEPLEEKYRSQLMGWREGSGTAASYTKRHIRRRAAKVSLEMQAEAFGAQTHDER
jgi:integrase